jgi:TPR repeat protein
MRYGSHQLRAVYEAALVVSLSSLGCSSAATSEPGPPTVTDVTAVERQQFDSKCQSGTAEACYHLAHALDQVRERDAVRAHLQRACELKYYVACTEDYLVATAKKNAALLKDACTTAAIGCSFAGLALRATKDEGGARALFERGCAQRDGRACSALGQSLVQREAGGTETITTAAVEYWEKGCVLEDGEGCMRASKAHRDGTGVSQDPDRGFSLFRRGAAYFALDCAAFRADACQGLAAVYETDDFARMCESQRCGYIARVGVGAGGDQVQRLAQLACLLGRATGCLTAKKPAAFNDLVNKTWQ